MKLKPYFWIQTLSEALTETKQIPLWGTAPPFPWETCREQLMKKFGSESLSLEAEKVVPREATELLEGLGASPILIPLNAAPLEGTLFWAMSLDDAKRLTTKLLTNSQQEQGFTDERFVRGFYNYLSLEILETLQEINPFHTLSFSIGEKKELPAEASLGIDVKIVIDEQPMWGRLICPPSFQRAFKNHFAGEKVDITSQKIASSLDVTLKLEAGSTTLSFEEWQSLSEGDFVILENCIFDPTLHKGTLEIVLGNTPLFQARLKEGSLKILDYAYFSEEEKLMDEPESTEENIPPEEPIGEEKGELPPEESLEEAEDPEHLWSEEPRKTPLQKMISTNEIPVSLTVEVGRLHMSLEKLLELEPGNTLELTTRPEEGVSITMQGKRIAHAELVKIGDVLGIKILKLGR